MSNYKKEAGLTLIEIIVVIGVLSVLFGLGTVVMSGFARQDRIEAEAKKITACLFQARVKTLAGYSYGQPTALNFGVHFESARYTLFGGIGFNPDNPLNQKFDLAPELAINDISLSSDDCVFEKITGQVRNFDPVNNYFILTDRRGNQKRKISINKLGVVTVEKI
ncbi:MAG: prepilin-type N-terminal cleavage/methylation domain-containing protein [Candidatus Pacebacteria bacterium]|nr:prepilin-type N-terminal cleavage/methylation domain-containing protein [Candidatus Paceibacterota bacterium]